MEIYPISGQYSIGDQLNCTADGMPIPTYTWHSLAGSTAKVVNGPILKVTQEMVNNKYTFQCQAINEVAGERQSSSKNITFTVMGKCKTFLKSYS